MYKDLFESFISDYHNWTRTYNIGHNISRELSFYLKMKQNRLQNKGLQIEEDFAESDNAISGNLNRDDHPYHVSIVYREALHILNYLRNGKIIRKFKEPLVFYATVLDKEGYEDEIICCPNCGHEASIRQLRNGCPYCATYFESEEAYPYITSFYSVPAIVERGKLEKNLKNIFLIPGIIIGLIVFISMLVSYEEYPWIFRIIAALFMALMIGGIGAFVTYMCFSIFLLFRLIFEAGRSLPLLSGINSKNKLERAMRRHDPDFSYEYFEGRLITLLRSIAFADKRDELSIYSGKEDLGFLDDLIDMSYRGSSSLQECRSEGEMIKVRMKVFLSNIYYLNDLKRRDETFIVEMEKKNNKQDLGFNVTAVNCKNCGASFDALHHKCCPHCGSEYELINDDWVVSSIRKAR